MGGCGTSRGRPSSWLALIASRSMGLRRFTCLVPLPPRLQARLLNKAPNPQFSLLQLLLPHALSLLLLQGLAVHWALHMLLPCAICGKVGLRGWAVGVQVWF